MLSKASWASLSKEEKKNFAESISLSISTANLYVGIWNNLFCGLEEKVETFYENCDVKEFTHGALVALRSKNSQLKKHKKGELEKEEKLAFVYAVGYGLVLPAKDSLTTQNEIYLNLLEESNLNLLVKFFFGHLDTQWQKKTSEEIENLWTSFSSGDHTKSREVDREKVEHNPGKQVETDHPLGNRPHLFDGVPPHNYEWMKQYMLRLRHMDAMYTSEMLKIIKLLKQLSTAPVAVKFKEYQEDERDDEEGEDDGDDDEEDFSISDLRRESKHLEETIRAIEEEMDESFDFVEWVQYRTKNKSHDESESARKRHQKNEMEGHK